MIIILCSMSGLAVTVGNVTVALNAGTYNITKDNFGYDVIVMEGFSDRVETGEPMLPQKTFDVLLPAEVDDSSLQLKIVSAKTHVLDGAYDIKPSPKWLPQDSNETATEIMINKSTYEANTNYPEKFVHLLPISQMRKWKYAPVNFIPFQYNPVTKKLTLHENVEIEISYNLKESSLSMAASFADTVLDDVAATKFINYNEMVGSYVSKEKAKLEPGTISVSDYVIITTNAIEAGSSKLSSFIEHKHNLGYNVLVVTEDDFDGLTGQSPNNRAEKIRQWLMNNYISNGIKYVLLIGNPTPDGTGATNIPMKMCWPRRGTGSYEECPTDYFYADLTGNWDKNGNGYYGELVDYSTIGGVDLAADVYVGRIPVYGTDYPTLDSILQKIINYETSSNTEWRKSALLPMSFSDSSTDGAYLGEQMKNSYLTPNGYTYWRMYQHGTFGSCTVNSVFSSEENLRGGSVVPNRWANSDFGIVSWWGHGNSQGAYVGYDPCSDGAFMLSSNAPSLDNAHPSHTYQCSCTNGYPEYSGNLQYAILKNGGITTTGATRVSWYYPGQTSFAGSSSNAGMGYEYMKRLVQGLAAGDALYDMKSSGVYGPGSYTEILMNFYDFCLYGDPSVSISSPNVAPTTPSKPSGPALGTSGTSYSYSTSANDPNGDQVKYTFDWADGTTSETGLVNSGTTASASHTWTVPYESSTTFSVRARSTDSHGLSSTDWSNSRGVLISNDDLNVDKTGVYYPPMGAFFLDANGDEIWDTIVYMGGVGYLPVSGDWNGDGKDELGVYYPPVGAFFLDTDGDGIWDTIVYMGGPGDLPVSGDWNEDGKDEVGVYYPPVGAFFLDTDGDGIWDTIVYMGGPGYLPVSGDWNKDGKDEVGVYYPPVGAFFLDTDGDGIWDNIVYMGGPGDLPVSGDWNEDGKDEVGVYYPPVGAFFLDTDGDGIWDKIVSMGGIGDLPVAGRWG